MKIAKFFSITLYLATLLLNPGTAVSGDQDIRGLELGFSPERVRAVLAEKYPDAQVRETKTVPLDDLEPAVASLSLSNNKARGDNEMIQVGFLYPPEAAEAVFVRRTRRYQVGLNSSEPRPAIAATRAALEAKYGEPTSVTGARNSGAWSEGSGGVLAWSLDPEKEACFAGVVLQTDFSRILENSLKGYTKPADCARTLGVALGGRQGFVHHMDSTLLDWAPLAANYRWFDHLMKESKKAERQRKLDAASPPPAL